MTIWAAAGCAKKQLVSTPELQLRFWKSRADWKKGDGRTSAGLRREIHCNFISHPPPLLINFFGAVIKALKRAPRIRTCFYRHVHSRTEKRRGSSSNCFMGTEWGAERSRRQGMPNHSWNLVPRVPRNYIQLCVQTDDTHLVSLTFPHITNTNDKTIFRTSFSVI